MNSTALKFMYERLFPIRGWIFHKGCGLLARFCSAQQGGQFGAFRCVQCNSVRLRRTGTSPSLLDPSSLWWNAGEPHGSQEAWLPVQNRSKFYSLRKEDFNISCRALLREAIDPDNDSYILPCWQSLGYITTSKWAICRHYQNPLSAFTLAFLPCL